MNYLLLRLLVGLVLAKRYPPSCNGHGLQKSRRIIGGHPIPISRARFMASLIVKYRLDYQHNRERLLCGVTIVGRIWGLTAASCLDQITKQLITNGNVIVRSNTTIWPAATRNYRSDHYIIEFFPHEKYDGEFNNYDNNLAMLKVNPAFSGSYEKPIDVAKPDYHYEPFSLVMLYGWGEVDVVTEQIHSDLQELQLRLVRPETCLTYIDADQLDRKNYICIEAVKDRDFCTRDIGGPVVQGGIAIGIMSLNPACAETYSHSYAIKLSNYYDWIFDKIRIN